MRAAIPSHQLGATIPGTLGTSSTTGTFAKVARRVSKSGGIAPSTGRVCGAITEDAATGDGAATSGAAMDAATGDAAIGDGVLEELDEDGVSIRRVERTRD